MKNDYPRVDKELYKKDLRAAYVKWEQLFLTYLAANETTGVSLDWTAVLDRAERQAYPSYPRPDNERRRQRHRAGQIKTLLLCTLAWQDYLPTLLGQFKAAHYNLSGELMPTLPPCCSSSSCSQRPSTRRTCRRRAWRAAAAPRGLPLSRLLMMKLTARPVSTAAAGTPLTSAVV